MSGKSVKVMLTSGRTLEQGRAIEKGKTSQEYVDAVAVCEIDVTALDALGIRDGDTVVIRSRTGRIRVKSKLSKDLQPGVAFMPCGPYFNALVESGTQQTGMPSFKAVEATIGPALNARVQRIEELTRKKKVTE